MPSRTARRAKVGKAQLRIPVSKGEREQDGVGGTWWLGDDDHIAGQADVTGSPALEWDGRALEVVEHVHDGGEVEVLHSALASLGQRQAQVLGYALEVEREHILPSPCLALPYQEHSVSIGTLQLNQLGCLHPGDGAMEPGIAGQEVICFLTGWVRHPPRRSTLVQGICASPWGVGCARLGG